jgi:signal transduction histidine kinase/CheY-like chemotaxis protein
MESVPGGTVDSGEVVLIYAPTGRDAELIRVVLHDAGHAAEVEPSVERLCQRMLGDCGVAIMAEEALTQEAVARLLEALVAQPSWADLPLVVLTSVLAMQQTEPPTLRTLRRHGNVTLLERPVHPVTVLSAVQAGLRARRRQYQVRDYLQDRIRTEERVREAQKMEAVGELAGGVAHEVNNMMTVVLGFGEFALRRLSEASGDSSPPLLGALRADVEEIVKAGRRAASITQQLLAFSRRQPRQVVLLHLQEVIPDLGKLLQRLAGASIPIDIQVPDDLPPVLVDRTQLEQAIINLVINARDSIPDFGSIRIAVDCIELDGAFVRRHGVTLTRDCRWLQVTVTDTGVGMDAATRGRAFDPFFTTKPIGQGTGLGLSTVYGIVKQSGGYVWLESEPGQGTTVRIHLPEAEVQAEEEPARPAVSARGGEIILVVEDEPVVRQLARAGLEDSGYQVMEAEDGADALALLARTDGQIDLVLSDVVMPRMGGKELNEALRSLRPDLPLLFMSGYPGQEVAERGLLDPAASFIQKPFSPQELAQRVRGMLDGRTLGQGEERHAGAQSRQGGA